MSGPIICVGHAALDRVYRVATLPKAAGKIRAIEHIESGGGMAANAAAAIAKLGGKVELWSRVGDDDSGRLIRNGLKSAGVDVRYVQTFADGRSSNAVVIVDDAGERLVVGARDVNMPNGTSWLPLERIAGFLALRAPRGARLPRRRVLDSGSPARTSPSVSLRARPDRERRGSARRLR